SATLCSWVRVASTTCSGHPSADAAAAIWSMTRLPFFSLVSASSLRQVARAFKAVFTPSRASLLSPATDMGLNSRGLGCAKPKDMRCTPLLNGGRCASVPEALRGHLDKGQRDRCGPVLGIIAGAWNIRHRIGGQAPIALWDNCPRARLFRLMQLRRLFENPLDCAVPSKATPAPAH